MLAAGRKNLLIIHKNEAFLSLLVNRERFGEGNPRLVDLQNPVWVLGIICWLDKALRKQDLNEKQEFHTEKMSQTGRKSHARATSEFCPHQGME